MRAVLSLSLAACGVAFFLAPDGVQAVLWGAGAAWSAFALHQEISR